MIDRAIAAILSSDSDLTEYIGDRYKPSDEIKGLQRPYITWEPQSSEDPAPSHDGPSGFWRDVFDIYIVADSYLECKQISEITKRIFPEYEGTVTGTEVQWIVCEDESKIESQQEPGRDKPTYGRVQQFKTLYKSV